MPPHPTSWISLLILSSHLRLGLPSGLFPSGFHTTRLLSPIRATRPAHLTLLDLITRIIFCKEYSESFYLLIQLKVSSHIIFVHKMTVQREACSAGFPLLVCVCVWERERDKFNSMVTVRCTRGLARLHNNLSAKGCPQGGWVSRTRSLW